MGNATLLLKKNGEKAKFQCTDIWGFTYNSALFRISPAIGQPMLVTSIGKLCYHENGLAHLRMIESGDDYAFFEVGQYFNLSKDLNSEVIYEYEKYLKKFRDENPEYKDVYECIIAAQTDKKLYHAHAKPMELLRACVKNR